MPLSKPVLYGIVGGLSGVVVITVVIVVAVRAVSLSLSLPPSLSLLPISSAFPPSLLLFPLRSAPLLSELGLTCVVLGRPHDSCGTSDVDGPAAPLHLQPISRR